jgi:regulator of extracellular matrix RemA (YlzA/DUF370 family)
MSEALKKKLIEECKRLDASYNPPLNHSINEIRSDSKLIKNVYEKKRKREVLIEECKRLDASYNPPLNHSIDEVRSDSKLIKSVYEEKRKREVLIEEYKRLDASYNPPLNHSFNNIRSDLKLINLQKRKKKAFTLWVGKPWSIVLPKCSFAMSVVASVTVTAPTRSR